LHHDIGLECGVVVRFHLCAEDGERKYGSREQSNAEDCSERAHFIGWAHVTPRRTVTLEFYQTRSRGLEAGASDYIAKPFSVREVVARVCSVLRAHQYEDQSSALSCDDLVLDALLFHAMFHA